MMEVVDLKFAALRNMNFSLQAMVPLILSLGTPILWNNFEWLLTCKQRQHMFQREIQNSVKHTR